MIDRIVDSDVAVLLLELKEERTELLCPVRMLPQGSTEGMWLKVEIEDGQLIRAEFAEEKNEEMKNRIRTKLALLRRRMFLGR